MAKASLLLGNVLCARVGRKGRIASALAVCLLHAALSAPCARAEAAALMKEINAGFQPSRPTVSLKYLLSYRFMFITLARMAEVRILATDGHWTAGDGPVPAAFLELRFNSLDDPDAGSRRRMSVHNRIVAVMTMPELHPIVYVKDTDEIINPLFGHESVSRHIEIYDFRSGEMEYSKRDLLTGKVETNIAGVADFTRQGREIPVVLGLMSEVYHGKRDAVTDSDDARVFVNVDGEVVPFRVTTSDGTRRLNLLDSSIPALRLRMSPARREGGRGRPFSLWATSYLHLARILENEQMIRNALESPEWNMVPLIADYGMAIGYVRGDIREVTLVGEWPIGGNHSRTACADADPGG